MELNFSQQGVTYCLKLPSFWKEADVTSILNKVQEQIWGMAEM